jgi:hypothetical protein
MSVSRTPNHPLLLNGIFEVIGNVSLSQNVYATFHPIQFGQLNN